MERGINYVDTARQYYDMEVVIGRLFPAKRDKLFITTKLLPELITPATTAEEITAAIEESRKRLNTDYIDCVQIHSVGEDPKLSDPAKIKNPNIVTAFEKAKKDGTMRFWGASSHGPRMVEDFDWLLDNTPIDLIQPGMNFMTKGLEPVLAKARRKGVAVVAMKSLAAARKIDYKPFMGEGQTVRQAVIKWTLAQPNIDCVAITMRSVEMIDEYVAASGRLELSPEEKKALKGYGTLLDRDYCRPGCSGCLAACPHSVPIADILRYRLYFASSRAR
jgi:predicted aldo/keto reductase-like oxidoreductase